MKKILAALLSAAVLGTTASAACSLGLVEVRTSHER